MPECPSCFRDASKYNENLKPVFKERTMIKTIFEEKYDEGFAVGIAEGEARGEARGEVRKGQNMLLTFLRAKFHKVPKDVENAIRKMTDSTAMESWAQHAATCQSIAEFAKAIR